ncbi:hypothetical protein OIU74_011789 [Salix koriyanagi]|uniref:Uncharacterized protein n=1 Tax=Salix koriyanagi TaxID=2511006 RepID=A0A9Q0TG53_9ROSI|nr:hypothetical protein OIU74_011789 [Salix koriyanagi]
MGTVKILRNGGGDDASETGTPEGRRKGKVQGSWRERSRVGVLVPGRITGRSKGLLL